jgi:hypothetical protein
VNNQSDECKHGIKSHSCRICKELPISRSSRVRGTSSKNYSGRKNEYNSDLYFGHSWPEWHAMRTMGSDLLKELAASRSFISYDKFWAAIRAGLGREIGSPWRQVPQLLRHIGDHSFDEFGLLLTALVVTDDEGRHPSEGFFRLASRVGLLDESDAPEAGVPWSGMTPNQRSFWQHHTALLFDKFDFQPK